MNRMQRNLITSLSATALLQVSRRKVRKKMLTAAECHFEFVVERHPWRFQKCRPSGQLGNDRDAKSVALSKSDFNCEKIFSLSQVHEIRLFFEFLVRLCRAACVSVDLGSHQR